MNNSTLKCALNLQAMSRWPAPDIGYLARGYSALIRAALTKKSRNELIVFAADIPAVVQHAEFII